MKYSEFRDSIQQALLQSPGMTWRELQLSLKLPYQRPCPEWTRRLEREIHLERSEKRGNALIWRLRDV